MWRICFRLTWLRKNDVSKDLERFWMGHEDEEIGAATQTRNKTPNSGSLCLEDIQYKTPTAASGIAYEEARRLSRYKLNRSWTEPQG